MGAHPFQIRTAINGSAYNDGISNNGVSNGTLTWDVQMDAPNVLYYQCTAHAGMVGKILIPNLGDGDNVSVQDFGAVGNGIVDDTTAIQSAIDSGAKHLTFPSGTYKLSSTINITSELHVSAKGAKFVQTDNATMFNFNVTSSANVYSLLSSYRIGVPTAVTIAAGGSGYADTNNPIIQYAYTMTGGEGRDNNHGYPGATGGGGGSGFSGGESRMPWCGAGAGGDGGGPGGGPGNSNVNFSDSNLYDSLRGVHAVPSDTFQYSLVSNLPFFGDASSQSAFDGKQGRSTTSPSNTAAGFFGSGGGGSGSGSGFYGGPGAVIMWWS